MTSAQPDKCYRQAVRADNMAGHPSEYPWSSYRYNALGQLDDLVTPHGEYLRLGKRAAERQKAYRALFKTHLAERTLSEIREATNKAWVLGSSYFKEQIERQSGRRVVPVTRGGDRKSSDYRERIKINRV